MFSGGFGDGNFLALFWHFLGDFWGPFRVSSQAFSLSGWWPTPSFTPRIDASPLWVAHSQMADALLGIRPCPFAVNDSRGPTNPIRCQRFPIWMLNDPVIHLSVDTTGASGGSSTVSYTVIHIGRSRTIQYRWVQRAEDCRPRHVWTLAWDQEATSNCLCSSVYLRPSLIGQQILGVFTASTR